MPGATGQARRKSDIACETPAATGRKIHFSGTTVYRIENGKVAEEVGQEGALTALQQLGLVPQR